MSEKKVIEKKMKKGKLHVQLMSNEKARRRQYEKRKTSLQKAATELSTLCGVDIGMIMFGPAECKDSEQPTAIWKPSNQEELAGPGLIEAYKARSCHDSRTKIYSLSDFFMEKTKKIKDDLEKLRLVKLNFKSSEELKQFQDGLMAKIDAVRRRINVMKGSRFSNSYYNPVQERVWNYEQQQQQFPNSYYNPVQESVWNYEQQQQQFPNSYYNPVQERVWNYEQQQQQVQPNFVYYSAAGSNTYNNQMMGYYGGGASNGMCKFDDQNNNAAYGAYGTGMMMPPLMSSYNDQMMPPLMSSYDDQMVMMPNEQKPPMTLEWFSPNPDGSGQKLLTPAVEWFLKEES